MKKLFTLIHLAAHVHDLCEDPHSDSDDIIDNARKLSQGVIDTIMSDDNHGLEIRSIGGETFAFFSKGKRTNGNDFDRSTAEEYATHLGIKVDEGETCPHCGDSPMSVSLKVGPPTCFACGKEVPEEPE